MHLAFSPPPPPPPFHWSWKGADGEGMLPLDIDLGSMRWQHQQWLHCMEIFWSAICGELGLGAERAEDVQNAILIK